MTATPGLARPGRRCSRSTSMPPPPTSAPCASSWGRSGRSSPWSRPTATATAPPSWVPSSPRTAPMRWPSPTSARASACASAGSPRPILVYPNSLPGGRAGGHRPRPHPDARGPRERPGLRGGGRGAVRRVRQGRRRARAAGRARRAGREDHRGHAGASAPSPGRTLRPSRTRPTTPILPTPSGSSAGSPRSSTSWRRVAFGCPSGCSPLRPSCCGFPQTYLNAVDPGTDALRHRLPRRDVAGAAAADAPGPHLAGHRAQGAGPARALRRAGAVSRDGAHAARRDPHGLGRRPARGSTRGGCSCAGVPSPSSRVPTSSTRGST